MARWKPFREMEALLRETDRALDIGIRSEDFYPPLQKATGGLLRRSGLRLRRLDKPVDECKEGILRSLGEGGYASARRP